MLWVLLFGTEGTRHVCLILLGIWLIYRRTEPIEYVVHCDEPPVIDCSHIPLVPVEDWKLGTEKMTVSVLVTDPKDGHTTWMAPDCRQAIEEAKIRRTKWHLERKE